MTPCLWRALTPVLAAAALAALPTRAAAQAPAYPAPGKTIRLVVGLAAGGSLDAQARVVAQKLTEQTGVQVLVQALSNPQVHEAIAKGAYETAPSSPAELASEIRSAYERWGAMIRQIGFQKQ